MKRILLALFFSALLGFNVNAQTVHTDMNDTLYQMSLPDGGQGYVDVTHHFANPTSAAITVQWRNTYNYVPWDWTTTGICDNATCLDFSQTQSWQNMVINPGDTGYIKVQVRRWKTGESVPYSTGCSYVTVEVNDPVSGITPYTCIHTSEASNAACWAVGTKDLSLMELVQVYPNPATNYLNLTIKDSRVKTVVLTNIIGKQLHRITTANSKSRNHQISMGRMPEGIYMLQFKDANNKMIGIKRITKR